jgi:hypothetical protein
MIVGAHQPSFLPWLGYLDKLAKSDVFVVMDDLQYEAQNFINRNRLKLNNGPHWMVVPLLAAEQTALICDRRIDNSGRGGRHHWQHRIWRTIEVHYGSAPHFEAYAPELEDVFARRWDSLLELDLHMLDLARRWLAIKTPIIRASSLGLKGAKTERILDMCKKLNAGVYLSGRGGSAGYLDTDLLAASGVSTLWQQFQHPTYPQRYGGFVSHLGFLDLVLNTGPEAAAVFQQHVAQRISKGQL